jgi:hypothetical protein
MTKTRSRKLGTYLQFLSLLVLIGIRIQMPVAANAQTQTPKHHFVCNVGYSPQECAVDMAALRKVLAKYLVDDVGQWIWVLVRSEDWKRILLDRGFDPNNPAFSYLPARETFLDGALVTKVSARGVVLRTIWRVPTEDLLDLAVRHELAHALCNERDETKADRVARLLHTGLVPTCEIQLAASSLRQPKGQR